MMCDQRRCLKFVADCSCGSGTAYRTALHTDLYMYVKDTLIALWVDLKEGLLESTEEH